MSSSPRKSSFLKQYAAAKNASRSEPVEKKHNIVEIMNLPSDDAKMAELEKLKGLLNKARSESDFSKKAKSLSKGGVWDELENLYKDLEQREKDYQVAVEIGKMLLDKNRDMSEEHQQLRQQYEQTLTQRDAQISELLGMVNEYNDKKQKMQTELNSLRMQVSILQAGNQVSEHNAFHLSESFAQIEDKAQRYKAEIKEIKQKNKEYVNEIEELKAEVERLRNEGEQLKNNEKTLRRQLKNNQFAAAAAPVPEEDKTERRKLEEEIENLADSYKRLENMLEEISTENYKLKESVQIREQEREEIHSLFENLQQNHHRLLEQEEEERRLLEEKAQIIDTLRRELEDNQLLSMNGTSVGTDSTLQKELADIAMSMRMTQRKGSLSRDSSRMFEDSNSHSRRSSVGSQVESDALLHSNKKDEQTLNQLYELRERLIDAEIKNISRAMPNVYYFDDIVQISNSIIDSVIKDTKRKIIEKRGESEVVRVAADLLLENCKLRKITNDYAEAINQGTIEKLDKFKKTIVEDVIENNNNHSHQPKKESPKRFWNVLPLFDFFSGWAAPPSDPNSVPL